MTSGAGRGIIQPFPLLRKLTNAWAIPLSSGGGAARYVSGFTHFVTNTRIRLHFDVLHPHRTPTPPDFRLTHARVPGKSRERDERHCFEWLGCSAGRGREKAAQSGGKREITAQTAVSTRLNTAGRCKSEKPNGSHVRSWPIGSRDLPRANMDGPRQAKSSATKMTQRMASERGGSGFRGHRSRLTPVNSLPHDCFFDVRCTCLRVQKRMTSRLQYELQYDQWRLGVRFPSGLLHVQYFYMLFQPP